MTPSVLASPTLTEAITTVQPFTIELLYGDHEGGQRAISRFSIIPRHDQEDATVWICTVGRHWSLDRPDPALSPHDGPGVTERSGAILVTNGDPGSSTGPDQDPRFFGP